MRLCWHVSSYWQLGVRACWDALNSASALSMLGACLERPLRVVFHGGRPNHCKANLVAGVHTVVGPLHADANFWTYCAEGASKNGQSCRQPDRWCWLDPVKLCNQHQLSLYHVWRDRRAGVGILYGIPIAVVIRWFPDLKGLAVGLTVLGFGMPALVTAPLTHVLIETYGILQTFLILGIALLVAQVLMLSRAAVPTCRAGGWRAGKRGCCRQRKELHPPRDAENVVQSGSVPSNTIGS